MHSFRTYANWRHTGDPNSLWVPGENKPGIFKSRHIIYICTHQNSQSIHIVIWAISSGTEVFCIPNIILSLMYLRILSLTLWNYLAPVSQQPKSCFLDICIWKLQPHWSLGKPLFKSENVFCSLISLILPLIKKVFKGPLLWVRYCA